jgi:hypothetical protein
MLLVVWGSSVVSASSLLVREINWLETSGSCQPLDVSKASFSLLVREINWLETGIKEINRKVLPLYKSPYSLGKLIDWKHEALEAEKAVKLTLPTR